ncbi:MAG: phenylalanine--tRNA ligase subunit beta [Rhodothalassiaceae bacterium]
MKFTLSWLKDHLETEATLDEIAACLTRIGLEVEGITDRAAALAPFTIARVIEAVPHPDADKLRVCRVETGSGEVQVVCGAPNARTGMKGVFAPPGSHVPGIDLHLKPTRIRGVESCGMLCSEREMMLSDEHDGIIELDPDAPVGESFARYAGLDDPVIEINITPNRPDALGVAGIARDLAAAGLGRVKTPDVPATEGQFDCPVRIEIADESACPAFAGRLIRGVRNGPSPLWMRRRLEAIGLRPISLLVDVTNYIAYDRARPLHVYDAGKIGPVIRARPARAGERFEALDGKIHETAGGECLIADDRAPLGFGGVMGGMESGVSAETVDVFIESALFDPIRTAETGRRHGIVSDARYRFERGVDPAFMIGGLELATRMILEAAGGEPSHVALAGTIPDGRRRVRFRPARVAALGGLDVPAAKARAILETLGFSWEGDGESVTVTAPGFRPDIDGEADIVEEVLRIHGYDAIPATPLPRDHQVARATLTPDQRRARAVRRRLAVEGLCESVSWSFMDSRIARLFGGEEQMMLENPISSELDMMRPSILPNLLLAAGRNRDRGAEFVASFEVGPVYFGLDPDDQATHATTLRLGASGPRDWRRPARAVDAYDAREDALAALEAAGAPVARLQVMGDAPRWYHPGRSGTLRLGPKTVLASFGEIHPAILKALDIKGPAVGAEIWLDHIPQTRRRIARGAYVPSRLPSVSRDFAFLVESGVPVAEIVRAAASADRTHIAEVSVFDVYEGKGIEPGRKSVAIAVRLEPVDTTFTEAGIDAIGERIVAAVEKATGGMLRR